MKQTFAIVAVAGPAGIAGAQQIPDINGDGAVDYAEFAQAFANELRDEIVGDRDGDGLITETDLRISIVQWYQALQGDLNVDGIVDSDDVGIVVANLGTGGSATDGDINLDNQIDAADFLAILDSLGESTLDVEEQAIFATAARLVLLANSLASRAGNPPHNAFFSNTWPGDHDWNDSEQDWAPNHDGATSRTWDVLPDHRRGDSRHWPANHDTQSSRSPLDGHDIEYSGQVWPPNHASAYSRTWPSDHTIRSSRRWPTGHIGARSADNRQSPHALITSSRWLHEQATSFDRGWPASHDTGSSGSWGPSHNTTISNQWPASHSLDPSSGWNDPKPAWPENHYADFSTTWEPPDPSDDQGGLPLFPRDHSVFTTFGGLIPFFGEASSAE